MNMIGGKSERVNYHTLLFQFSVTATHKIEEVSAYMHDRMAVL